MFDDMGIDTMQITKNLDLFGLLFCLTIGIFFTKAHYTSHIVTGNITYCFYSTIY